MIQVAAFEHPASITASQHKLDQTSLRAFIENSDIRVKKLDEEEIVFDLIGAEPPLANALRRILIAEIPTMAIEKVEMWQNTSIIPDENLAHRMGLIPLAVDPRIFEYKTSPTKAYDATNSLRFKLHLVCTKKIPGSKFQVKTVQDEEEHYNNANVYSGDLEWIPIGD